MFLPVCVSMLSTQGCYMYECFAYVCVYAPGECLAYRDVTCMSVLPVCVNMNIMCASSLVLLEGGLRTPVHKAMCHVNASN